MKYNLREYQIDGIKTIKEKLNYGLFWQQRLGKTIVAIKAVEEYKKIIFAVPNNLIFYWQKEINENCKNIDCSILPKLKSSRLKMYQEFKDKENKWIIGSYDTLSLDVTNNQEYFSDFDYLVVDESHFLRNRKSKRSKGMYKLRKLSKYCIALSGTPAVNTAIDILRIFRLIYNDPKYGNKYYYKKRYYDIIKNDNKITYKLKESMLNEWNKMISELCDVKNVHEYLKWLPPSVTKNIYLEMKLDQLTHYKKMLIESKRIITEDKEKTENKTITQIIRLQQLCLDPKILDINSSSIKIEWMMNYIKETLENDEDERIIIFTNFSSLFKKWGVEFDKEISYSFLTGTQTLIERSEIINDFQSGKIKVLFANMKVAALGLTLDRATISIFLEKSWDPTNNEQAAFRMVDTKKKKNNQPKLIINLICNNSIDEKIIDVLQNKKEKTNFIYEFKKYILS